MISAYNSLITYSEENWQDYLERLCLIDIFSPLLKEFPDKGDFTCVVKYILWAYSAESEMLVIGADWGKTKKKIFEKALIRPEASFYAKIVHLQSEAVLKTIQNWLDYQDDELFTQIQTLKDLRFEMQTTCLTGIKKASGEIDYDQKYKNAEYSVKLKETIKDLESQLIQNSAVLKDSVKEFREAKKGKQSFGVETFFKE